MNDMVDMSRFVEAKSDQLNADDLIGVAKTITITKVTGNDGDQPVSIFYKGDNGKPFKPCKTVRRVLMAVWGRYANDYVGKSMTLYRDDKVTFGGLETGGIRVSHMSHIDKEMIVVVMKTKGKKAGLKIQPLDDPRQGNEAGTQRRQTPAEWTDEYIARLDAAGDRDALIAVQESAGKALAKLKTGHADLYARAVEAGERRLQVLAGEGRSDVDHGDQHDGAEQDGW